MNNHVDYGQGAIDLMELMGVDADDVVGDLMVKLKLVQQQADARYNTLKDKLDEVVAEHKAHLEVIDDIASRHDISVPCRSCDNYYVLDFELSKYDANMSYCGGSPRCCP